MRPVRTVGRSFGLWVERIVVMLPSNPQPLHYRSSAGRAPRTPQLWVLCVLVLLHFVGIGAGRMLWGSFYPGKDPQREYFWANCIVLGLLAILCVALKKRLNRFRVLDALVVLALGFGSSIAGMYWGVLDGYGR